MHTKIIKLLLIQVLISLLLLNGCGKDTTTVNETIIPETYKITVEVYGTVDRAYISTDFSHYGEVKELPWTQDFEAKSADYIHFYSHKVDKEGTLIMTVRINDEPLVEKVSSLPQRESELEIGGYIIDEKTEGHFFRDPDDIPERISQNPYPNITYVKEWYYE